MDQLYALTLEKQRVLTKDLRFEYVCIWEHDWVKKVAENPDVRTFVASLDIQDRLDPRESFFGGRTNAAKLKYKAVEGEKIKYVDFTRYAYHFRCSKNHNFTICIYLYEKNVTYTSLLKIIFIFSLYPYVNKYARYPIGHPKIITSDFEDISAYFGIAKIKILAPRGLYHPVLPYRSNDKLKFPLCRTCADTESRDACHHTDEQRSFTGTWCTPEIEKALQMGYTLLKVYEVYHWDESTQHDRSKNLYLRRT